MRHGSYTRDDLPPGVRRTAPCDRVSEAPALLWMVLGLGVVVAFVVFGLWVLGPPLPQ